MIPHDDKNTRWTGFAASIPGGGHIRHGIPCQDASAVMTSPRPALIVCDGRGSAKLSHFGAQGAVDAFRFQMSILEPFLVNILDDEEEKQDQWIKFCRIMYRTFMQVKYDLAEKHNQEEKEFDCTVAFAIAGKKHIGCFQVGDGSIVLRQNGVCKTVFPPEKGEFANQTHFLRPGGEEEIKFQFALLDSEVNSGIAVTSDGPEHLMFHLADMTPGKIFDIFLDDLRKEELSRQDLMDYLTRREWADDPRGSDDRSLALLVRIGAEPASSVTENVTEESVTIVSALNSKVAPEAQEKDEVKPNAETKDLSGVQTAPVESEKKTNSYWVLAIVSSLLIGLSAETVCLWKQQQTISRQKMEIKSLKQQLPQKKQQQKQIPPKGSPQPSMRPAPTEGYKGNKETPMQPRRSVPGAEKESKETFAQSQTSAPDPKKKLPDLPKAKTEKKIRSDIIENPKRRNTLDEDTHHEK